jgi:hypothetical protein
MVLVSATVELNVNTAAPFAPVEAEPGVILLPVPLAATLTNTPGSRLLLPSRTTTVMVLCPPTAMVDGEADTPLFAALGPPAVAVEVNVTGEPLSPLTVAVVA